MFVLEAMAAGRPCVVSNVGAMPTLGSGIVVERGDVAQLAAALLEYLRDSRRARDDGQQAYETFRREFSSEIVREQLFAMYRKGDA